jgi:hypothetical protein
MVDHTYILVTKYLLFAPTYVHSQLAFLPPHLNELCQQKIFSDALLLEKFVFKKFL